MTPEQIDMEFAHISLDKKVANGNKETFEDEEYEAYDKETEERDKRLYIEEPIENKEGGWEDI